MNYYGYGGNNIYGVSDLFRLTIGSGGGGGIGCSAVRRYWRGGGIVRIQASTIQTIGGIISAKGADGGSGSGSYKSGGGGGAGGSIYLEAASIEMIDNAVRAIGGIGALVPREAEIIILTAAGSAGG